MNLKEVISTKRLPKEQEITLPELAEVYGEVESKSNEDLIELVHLLKTQGKELEKEKDLLRSGVHDVRNGYTIVKGDPGDTYRGVKPFKGMTEEFADAKLALDKALGGVSLSRTDVLENPRMAGTEEVKEYKAKRTRLRAGVKELGNRKDSLEKSMDRFGEVSFRGEKREEVLNRETGIVDDVAEKISGSIKGLEFERNHAIEVLVERAQKEFWKDKSDVEYNDLIVGAALYGIEAIAKAAAFRAAEIKNAERKGSGNNEPMADDLVQAQAEKYIEHIKDSVQTGEGRDVLIKMGELNEHESEVSKNLAELKSQRVGVYTDLFRKFKKPLNELPLNIEVHGPGGGPGAYASEGEVVATAWNYEGLDELKQAERKLQEGLTLSQQMHADIKAAENALERERIEKPVRAYHLWGDRKNKHKAMEEELSIKKTKWEILQRELDDEQRKIEELRRGVKVTKEPVDVLACVNPRELNGHLYIHQNYGRGFAGARQKDPIQTVEDFFTFFYGERESALTKIKEEKSKLQNDPKSEAYLKIAEQLQMDWVKGI